MFTVEWSKACNLKAPSTVVAPETYTGIRQHSTKCCIPLKHFRASQVTRGGSAALLCNKISSFL